MTNNQDPGDVTSLEAVFESRHFGHTPETIGAGHGSAVRPAGVPAGVEDTIFRKEFGEAPRDVPMRSASGTGGNAPGSPHDTPPPVPAGTSSTMGPELPPVSAAGAGSAGAESLGSLSPTPAKRDSNTYRVIAAASCVAALVIAGVTSQAGEQHRPSSVSAQGHRGGLSQGGSGNRRTLGAPSTETQVLGGATTAGSRAAGHRVSVVLASSTSGARGAPAGHVSVSGAATYNGTPPASSSPSPSGSPGSGGSAPSPPATGNSPAAPVATLVAGTLSTVASTATSATGQLSSSVPATGAVSNTVGTAVGDVSQVIGSTTS